MRFILVRHGETVQNKDKIIQGQLPGELSEHGKSQVRKTARELASTNIKRIFSSDLNRCKQTAEILIKPHENAEIIYDERLRELSFGEWEGLAYDELPVDIRLDGLFHNKPPGGESIDEHGARAVSFINETYRDFKASETVLVVTHGGTIRLLLALYYSVPLPNLWALNTANAQSVFMDVDKPLPNKIKTI